VLDSLEEQERTGRPLGEIVVGRYRLSSLTLEKLLNEQRELEVELDRGFASGLRGALQRRAGAPTVTPTDGENAPVRSFGLTERLTSPSSDPRTHVAMKQVEAGDRRIAGLNDFVATQRGELGQLRDALIDRQLTIIELEQRVSELEALLPEHAAPSEPS
jgi:hypothetical protein